MIDLHARRKELPGLCDVAGDSMQPLVPKARAEFCQCNLLGERGHAAKAAQFSRRSTTSALPMF